MSSSANIPDDVKIMLRSVLISSPGVKQSNLCKEYKGMIDENLTYCNMGFKNLYEFLKALEGEVTRIEFSAELEDNVVYAELDKSKYVSKHAQKNAVKYGTGIPSKTPEEINHWLMERKGTIRRDIQTTKKRSKLLSGLVKGKTNNMKPLMQTQPVVMKEMIPTSRELVFLCNLRPDNNGWYTLCVRNIGVSRSLALPKDVLLTYLKQYNPSPNVNFFLEAGKSSALVHFSLYKNAYQAWKLKSNTILRGQRLELAPQRPKSFDNLISCFGVIVVCLPASLLMTTLIDAFNQYSSLIYVEPHWRDRSATAFYKLERSAIDAASGIKMLKGLNDRMFEVTAKLIPKRKLSFNQMNMQLKNTVQQETNSSINNTNNTTFQSNMFQNRSSDGILGTPSTNGMFPTPATSSQFNSPFQARTSADGILSTPSNVTKISPPSKSPPITFNRSPATNYVKPSVVTDEKPATSVDLSQYDKRKCGFCLDYKQSYEMFQETCKKNPRTCKNVAKEIGFIVTFPVDSCRFWIMVVDPKNETYSKLLDIEADLIKAAERTQPPNVLPKEGVRGSALYTENKTWYRCWVMSSKVESDEVTVFFCDYGNVEVVSRANFRSTYSNAWVLPPFAVPCIMSGYENSYVSDAACNQAGVERLLQLLVGKQLRGKVVKDATYSQPHIIELNEIHTVMKPTEFIEDIMLNEGFIKNIEKEAEATEEDESAVKDEKEEVAQTLFDYDAEQLVVGMIAEVHKPQLLYLHLGSLEGLQDVEKLLNGFHQPSKAYVEKGAVLMLIKNGLRRRVLVLQTDNKEAKILHTDFGTIETVLSGYLYDISDEIFEYPFQARPAMLAGIQCTDKISTTKTIEYLKKNLKKPLKCNIIKENDIGKVTVELFPINTTKSINKELLDLGYATCDFTQNASEDNQNMLEINENEAASNECSTSPVQKNEEKQPITVGTSATIPRKSSTVSTASWDSTHSLRPSPSRLVSQALQANSSIDKSRVNTWVENTVVSPPQSVHRPSTPDFPPPDIITSTNLPTCSISEYIRVEGNCVILGAPPDRLDYITIDNHDNVKSEDVDKLKTSWKVEKASLLDLKTKLEALMKLNTVDLNNAFKERKKEKLKLKIRVKDLEKKVDTAKLEYETVNKEIEDILAKI